MVEQGTHKPLVGSPNLPLGTLDHHTVVFFFALYVCPFARGFNATRFNKSHLSAVGFPF